MVDTKDNGFILVRDYGYAVGKHSGMAFYNKINPTNISGANGNTYIINYTNCSIKCYLNASMMYFC